MFASRPRTRRPFTDADVVRLRALYDDRSIPLQQVANAFAVPVSTLLRWVAEMDWPRRSARALPAPALAPTPPTAPHDAMPAPRAAPQLLSTLLRVSQLARRELADLAVHRARTLEERERVARLVASLTRSLERVDEGVRRERDRRESRRYGKELARRIRLDEAGL